MSTVIKVENLGKKYIISHKQQGRGSYRNLREEISAGVKNAGKYLLGRKPIKTTKEEFWALKDVSFDVELGERIGIIGRNGAGKSTLLKMLSRITEPSTGSIKLKGRVASLLEVGTGFHPELTGRENTFLNGAIFGMQRIEIKRKFDEIVDFAGIEKFLDTPVKRYSSGMYVRLAFAVAAHLEPEILVVDEVLAVGDVEFQKKCLGKMEDVSTKEGRTVLFVSHIMGAISLLCNRTILLQNGSISKAGNTSKVIAYYFNKSNESFSFIDYTKLNHNYQDKYSGLLSAKICNSNGMVINEVTIDESFYVRMTYKIKKKINGKCVPNFHFFTGEGSYIFVSSVPNVKIVEPGIYTAICEVPPHLMNNGIINIGVALTTYIANGHFVNFFDKSALNLNIIDLLNDSSRRYGYSGEIPGYVRPHLNWEIIKED